MSQTALSHKKFFNKRLRAPRNILEVRRKFVLDP